MNILLISMPDIAPIIINEAAIHMPNLGIASVAGNIDEQHEVRVIDLVRRRRNPAAYLTQAFRKFPPDLVGLSAMAWQYDTCRRIARLVRQQVPQAKIAVGGYHATLMSREIALSDDAEYIDYIVRGEGEECIRRLANALDGKDSLADISGLSWKSDSGFIHNPRGGNLDLARLKRPVRDSRRVTGGYHIMNSRVEVMETSRGCTRACNFCSIRRMYGRSFRMYPLERVMAELDEIYYERKTRWIFIADDNMVLNTQWVHKVCDAIIERKYKGLKLVVQADCVTMSQNEKMVAKMAAAGFKSVFLGIENVAQANLDLAEKTNSASVSRAAVEMCHKHGIMVIGGLVLGFPDDDEASIIRNFEFFKSTGVDGAYCQMLTPYPKTGIRQTLMDESLVTNYLDLKRYNGLWANVRTRHLGAEELQYLFWHHKERILGWWEPSDLIRRDGRIWTDIWRLAFKPVIRYFHERHLRKIGWQGSYQEHLDYMENMNRFPDLEAMDNISHRE